MSQCEVQAADFFRLYLHQRLVIFSQLRPTPETLSALEQCICSLRGNAFVRSRLPASRRLCCVTLSPFCELLDVQLADTKHGLLLLHFPVTAENGVSIDASKTNDERQTFNVFVGW